MEITAETLVLSIIFLLPGYAAHRLTGYFSPTPQRHISTFDSLLTSLGTTVGILLWEAAVVVGFAGVVFFTKREWLSELELDTLVDSGFRTYLVDKPWETVLFLGGAAILTALIAFWWGLNDPVGKHLRSRQLQLGLAPSDMWVMALQQDREAQGFGQGYALVRVKETHDTFQGVVRGFSFPSGDSESRDVYLQNVTYAPSGDLSKAITLGAASSTILNSRDIESITIVYV